MFQIAVVAHIARARQAQHLADTVGANISMDYGTLGCETNHRQAWSALTKGEWGVVLEDDAVPVEDFTHQLQQALTVAPTPIVSLYLGTGFPVHHQPGISLAINNAQHADASWIISSHLLHAVGVAIRTDLIPDMLEATRSSTRDADDRISDWAKANNHLIAYTHPSLIDHADTQSLTAHSDLIPRLQPRKAWTTGTRTQWTTQAVTL